MNIKTLLLMAENKKKVVVYTDWLKNFEDLTDEELGKLMRHFFMYINDMNPILEDRLLKIAWNPIETTLKRDLKKWEDFVSKQKENGAKGGRPKETQITQAFLENPKKADSVSDSVSVSVIKINNIDSRKQKFASTLKEFSNIYSRDMLKEFYAYWTEPNKSNTKFRQELEKTWDVKRRLDSWSKNDNTFKSNKPQPEKKSLGI